MRFGILAAAAFAFSTPTQAAVYIITYTGTITSGVDGRQLFGGGDLSGFEYTSIYTLTYPGNFQEAHSGTSDAGIRSVFGSTEYDPTAQIPLTGTMTINGITHWYGDYYGWAAQTNNDHGNGGDEVQHVVVSSDPVGGWSSAMQNNLYSYTHDFVSSWDFTAPLAYNLQQGDGSYGSFASYSGPVATHPYTYLDLRPLSVTIVEQSPVPEPSTWALLLIGFGLVGVSLRRAARQKLALA